MEENQSPFGSREIARNKDKLAFISFAKQNIYKSITMSLNCKKERQTCFFFFLFFFFFFSPYLSKKNDNDSDKANGEDEEVFEVEKVLGICYGDPKEIKNTGIIS